MSVVRLEIQDAVGHIVLDRPPANSYDKAFLDDLSAAIDEARFNSAAKAIVVRSASEKFFCAGADVKMFASTDSEYQFAFVIHANEIMSKFERTPKIVVCAINGHCLGGGLEIALCADIRIAAEGTYNIGLPEVTLGVLPGTGGTQRLPRLIGRQKALELMIRGNAVPTTVSPSPSASPADHASGTPSTSGRRSRASPGKGSNTHRPTSLPLSSWNQTTPSPSGVGSASTTPMG